jgi:hypothetical protein
MLLSSWNFTPDPRGKIHINKPSPGIFLIPGECLNYKEIKDFPLCTVKVRASIVKLIRGGRGMRKG